MPAAVLLLLLLLSCACGACGARQSGGVPARSAQPAQSAQSAQSAKPAQPWWRESTDSKLNLNSPVSARAVTSGSDPAVTSAVVPAEGVQLKQWARVRQAERERREADPRAHARAEKVHQARASGLPAHEREALEALEAALVEEINRMRTDPAAYAATLSEFRTMYRDQAVVVPGYMSVRTHEGVAAVDDAIAMAMATPPMVTLTRSPGLTGSARAHAYQLGRQSNVGRGDEDGIALHGRLDAYGRVNGMFAENIGAVYRDAGLMLLELFVDDGVESRVHRFNMIGSMFRVVGVGCAPHPTYDVVCVMDFAESYREASVGAR